MADLQSEGQSLQVIDLAYEDAHATIETLARWYDAMDAKIVAIFGVSSLIAGLVPIFATVDLQGWRLVAWAVALLTWAVSVGACFWALVPRHYRLDPHPKTLLNPAWMDLNPQQYRYYRLEDIAASYRVNRAAYLAKANALTVAVGATSLEVLSLVIALVR